MNIQMPILPYACTAAATHNQLMAINNKRVTDACTMQLHHARMNEKHQTKQITYSTSTATRHN
jgi:hypothetical protein